MKVKTILLTLLVCLSAMFVMAACFDNTGDEPSVHKHAYIAVEETPSTCIKAGTKSHYKCDECGKLFVKDGDEYVERTEADLALPLAAHSFNGITVKTNPTKTIYTAFEAFDPTGIKVVKTCSVAGCEGEEAEDRDVTFAYEKENADKLTADMTKVVIKAAGFETEFAVTVNKIVVKLPVIESKEYTGEAQVASVPESELYTVTENNGGTDIGKYDVKLKRDKDVGTYSLEINSDNLWQELHSDQGNDSSLGLSLIESGNRLGGVGGAGIIAVGALTAVGQLITEKADKEARYTEGVAQRVKDIKALANEKEKALALSNELYELTVPLKECHKIYLAELETIAATYESGIDEKLIKALVKLSKVYNAMNKNVAKGK